MSKLTNADRDRLVPATMATSYMEPQSQARMTDSIVRYAIDLRKLGHMKRDLAMLAHQGAMGEAKAEILDHAVQVLTELQQDDIGMIRTLLSGLNGASKV